MDDVVLRDEADLGVGAVRHGGAVVQHGTRRGQPQPGDDLEQRGLAGAATADERAQLAGRHRERHLVQELPAAGAAGHGEHIDGHAGGRRLVGLVGWPGRAGGS